MTMNEEFWTAQAEEMELLIGMRSASIEVLQLRRDLKESLERAAIFEEWKDKVEEQRRGLEIQVGEIESQRQKLEQELNIMQQKTVKLVTIKTFVKVRKLLSKIKKKLLNFFNKYVWRDIK